jgi:hypothetical protein
MGSRRAIVLLAVALSACAPERPVPPHKLLMLAAGHCFVLVSPAIAKDDEALLAIADHYLPESRTGAGEVAGVVVVSVWDNERFAPSHPKTLGDVPDGEFEARVAEIVVNSQTGLRQVKHLH